MVERDADGYLQDPSVPTDGELIERCLAGDEQAWDHLLRRYGRLIYSVALQNGLTADDAADVFQMVSMTMLTHLAELRDVDRFPAWVATVARRHALHVIERNRRSAGGESAQQPNTDVDVAAGEDPENLLSSLRDQILVQQAMERLPERCRQLLSLLFSEEAGVSYAEIAERLKMPIGSVGPTRARCLERLRQILEEMGF